MVVLLALASLIMTYWLIVCREPRIALSQALFFALGAWAQREGLAHLTLACLLIGSLLLILGCWRVEQQVQAIYRAMDKPMHWRGNDLD